MRVLVIHRYFWPDTPPYATLLRAIADRWSADGHEVTVLTSQPSYNRSAGPGRQPPTETLGSLNVRRVGLLPETKSNMLIRVMNLVLFMVRIAAHIIFTRRRFDVVMAATTPPVMIAWIARLVSNLRGAEFVYHCQDVHPELLRWSGLIRSQYLYRCLLAMDTWTMRCATRVVVLSTDMERTVHERTLMTGASLQIINNFVIPDYGRRVTRLAIDEVKGPNKFRVLFAGNIGHFQGLDSVIECARRLQDLADIEFVFVGDGAAKHDLIVDSGNLLGRNIRFFPFRPHYEAELLVETADLCLVTLAKNVIRAAYPSKTMTYLNNGRPILVLVEPDSELARLTRDERIGYVAAPADIEAIMKHILDAHDCPKKLEKMGSNARTLAHGMFGREVCLRKWSQLLEDIQNARSPT